jgi:hypothetical protein
LNPGAVANDAESRKASKYRSLSATYTFTPVAVETLGPLGDEASKFFRDIGNRIATATSEQRSHQFLMQRLSVAIQRGNAACVLGTVHFGVPQGSVLGPFYTYTARDLGVTIDSQLSLTAHVSMICRFCYYQLRQLRSVTDSLSVDASKALVHAFISSRLDYCNSLLYGIADGLLKKLQSVQNAAARLITRSRRRDHIAPVLRELHWLPVRQRIKFKVACLVFQSLSNQAPEYLSADCRLVTGSLRSADTRTCAVPRTHNSFGDRSFSTSGPYLWNTLPKDIRQADISYIHFKRLLKTFLFQ